MWTQIYVILCYLMGLWCLSCWISLRKHKKFIFAFSIIFTAHSGHKVLSCPVPPFRPSVRPALITTLQPIIFNGSCSYMVQPLTLVGAWTLLNMGFYVHFLGSCGTLKFYGYTNWLVSWTRPAKGSRPLDGIFEHWDAAGCWNRYPWKTRTCSACMVNTMAVDGLATEGARAAAAIVLS